MAKHVDVVIPYQPRPFQSEMHRGLETHRWSVVVAHRRFGKTICVINHLIKMACRCKKRRPHFGYIAPLYSQAKSVAWEYLKYYTAPIPGRKVNESELWVELPSKARLRLFGSDNPDSLRGMYFDGVVMDEVADMKPNVWKEVVSPALADREGFAVFIGTPRGMNLFYELYNKALKLEEWFAAIYPASITNILPQSEIDHQKSILSEQQYQQEMECDFGASSEDIFIPLALAIEAAKRKVDAHAFSWAKVVFGVDPARFGGDRSVVWIRQGLHTWEVKRFKNLNLMDLASRVMHLAKEWKPGTVFVDEVGLGAGLLDRLHQLGLENAVGVNGGSKPSDSQYKNKRAESWADMKKWLQSGGSIPNEPDILTDLSSVNYKFDVADRLQLESKEDIRKRVEFSPDTADALALTFAYPVVADEPKKNLSMAQKDFLHITGQGEYDDYGELAVNMDDFEDAFNF